MLDEGEKYFIKKYNTLWPNGLNFTKGGVSLSCIERYEAGRLVNSYKHMGEKNGFYGKKHTQDEIERMRKSYFETMQNKNREIWQVEKSCKKVYMYDLNMNFIKEFSSINE